MGFLSYLTTAAPTFGPLAWLFFIAQIIGVGAGAYLYFAHSERNPARHAFMRQLGLALMILGGVGALMGSLRLLNVPYLNQRLWFWVQGLIELGVGAYVLFYIRSVLPGLEKAAAGRGGRPGQQRPGVPRPPRAVPDAASATPRPVATTGRRDARRDRKRKGR